MSLLCSTRWVRPRSLLCSACWTMARFWLCSASWTRPIPLLCFACWTRPISLLCFACWTRPISLLRSACWTWPRSLLLSARWARPTCPECSACWTRPIILLCFACWTWSTSVGGSCSGANLMLNASCRCRGVLSSPAVSLLRPFAQSRVCMAPGICWPMPVLVLDARPTASSLLHQVFLFVNCQPSASLLFGKVPVGSAVTGVSLF